MTALRRAPSLVTGFHELSSNRSVLGGGIVSRMFSESNASTSGSLPCNTRNFSARARAPREFEPRSPQEMGYSQRFSLNYREIAEQKHAERLEDTGVRAVLQEEYADDPEAHVVDAVRKHPWQNAAFFLRYGNPALFKSIFRGLQFREMARVGTSWARSSEAVRHQEATLSDKLGVPVEIMPIKFESLALSAQFLAQDIALTLHSASEKKTVLRKVVEAYRDDVILPNRYIKGYKIRVKGKITAGMAQGFTLSGGSTHATSFTSSVDVGVAHAQTSVGKIGIKVWLIYHPGPWEQSAPHMDFWGSLKGK